MTSWAIDIGNSNSGIARWDDRLGSPSLVELPAICRRPAGAEPLEAPRLIPSATLVDREPDLLTRIGRWPIVRNRLFLGREAIIGRPALEANERLGRPGFVRSFKSYLGRDSTRALGRFGRRTLTARDVAQLFVRELLAEASRVTGERPRDLVLTVPVEAYESYRAELLAIARRLGFAGVRFIDEPVAAALGYGLSAMSDRLVLVVDFGAGTLNVALVTLRAKDLMQGRAAVVAKTGRAVGGHHVTSWVLDHLVQAMALDTEARNDDETDVWRRMMFSEAERVKERLFFAESAAVHLEPPSYLRRPGATGPLLTETTRAQLRELLEARALYSLFDGAVDEVLGAAAGAGLREDDVDEVLMVGGSTLLPEIYPRMESRFGRDRVRAWQPFEAVAYGACAFANGSFTPTDFIVHDYAFVTYHPTTHEPEHRVIIPRGTSFPTQPDLWKQQLVPTCSLGEPEEFFRLVISEVGSADSDERRFHWDVGGRVTSVGGVAAKATVGEAVVVPLNESNPTLGTLDPPHTPDDRRPRLEVMFGVNADRWLVATVNDLKTNRPLMKQQPVVRLL